MALKKKQKQAIEILKSGQNVFLSGEAGTGKSYVIEQFIKYLDKIGKKYAVAAPTGLAAQNLGGVTLHRTFGLPIGPLTQPGNMKNIKSAEVLIIDEISMCRVDLFRAIANALFSFQNKQEWEGEEEEEVVRVKQLVVVGDFFQLPPVLTEKDAELLQINQDQAYAFCCPEWERFNFRSIVLDEVIRQTERDFIENLNKIRVGDSTGLNFISNNSTPKKLTKAIALCGRNKDAERLNESSLKKLKSKEFIYYANIEGEVKKEDMATLEQLKLKKNARVMCLVNRGENIANGMMGKITGLNSESVTVQFDNGEEMEFEPYKWSIKGYVKKKGKDGKEKIEEAEIGSFTQIPLKLAYAITIHKSQGQTYEAVNLDPDCFAVGQLYVGLSRVKTLKKLYLTQSLQKSYLKTSEAVKSFYSGLGNTQLREVKEIKFITMSIPENLKEAVIGLLENRESIIQNQEKEQLESQIECLKKELEQLKASAKRRPKISKEIEERIITLRKEGMGMNKIAKEVKCGDGTVRRVIKDYGMV